MSCGNRFQCGITRFQKHSFTSDKPSNPELHGENQKRLSEMLKAREDMDKVLSGAPSAAQPIQSATLAIQSFGTEPINETQYTPWKTPSAQNYEKKTK